MLNIKLICVGKLKEKFYKDACAEYEKRLGGLCRLEICQLDEERGGVAAESASVLARVPKGAFVISMCVEGAQLSSEELAQKIDALQTGGCGSLCFIIGSSNGLDESVKAASALRLSMSRMTFPHHLARVMVLEQIYRALSIMRGGKYHK